MVRRRARDLLARAPLRDAGLALARLGPELVGLGATIAALLGGVPRFRIGGRTVRTICSVMRFDSAIDVPADDESDAYFRG